MGSWQPVRRFPYFFAVLESPVHEEQALLAPPPDTRATG